MTQHTPRGRRRNINHAARARSESTHNPPGFEALEARVLLSYADLSSAAVGSGSAWESEMVGVFAPEAVYAPQTGDAAASQGDSGAGAGVLISGVPVYIWHRGCGPTTGGMILGYWDGQGYDNLVSGSAATQTSAVNDMMASPEHYADYSQPIDSTGTGLRPDKSQTGGAHANNSLADYMETSFSASGNYYGWSWFSDIDNALEDYAASRGYTDADGYNRTWGSLNWDTYTAAIDSGAPVGLIVDTDGDGWTNHFIAGIGYNADTNQYAAYNTWDSSVHWYDFAQMASGQSWGIYGATFFDPGQLSADGIAPTATVTAADVTTSGEATYTFTVTYSDNVAVDVSDLDGSDVRVTGPNGYSQYATFLEVDVNSDGTPRTATYRITAPGGSWNLADNGTYTVSLLAGQVSDTSGNFAAATTLGTFDAALADAVLPVADLTAANITTSGESAYTFTVTYSDNVAVDVSDLNNSDIRVTGPNGYSQNATFVGVDVNSDGTPRTATYRITAPGGSWDLADNGTYTVSLLSGQVSDTSGNLAAATALGTFSVDVADTVAPTADLTITDVTESGSSTHTFTITFSDNVAIDVSRITSTNIRVTGPNEFGQYASLLGVDIYSDGTPRTATLSVTAPGGSWDFGDNGTYTVSIRASQVADLAGNFVEAGVLGTFEVALADEIAPSADLTVESITSSSSTHTFTVTYSDNEAVDVSDLNGSDIRVTGPNGYSQYATFLGVDVNSDGTPRTATYRITAPGGSWDLADNGTYTVSLQSGQVSDNSGNFAPAGTLGTFSVNVAQPEPEPEPEPEEVVKKFGSFSGQTGVRLTLLGANDVVVTYSIKGSGYGQIVGEAGSEQIVLYGTNSKSSLIITSDFSGAAVGDIVVNGSIGTISLRDIDLVGDITITGTASQILINDVFGPSTITIGAANSYRDSVSFRMHNVEELSIDSGTPIRSISVANWADTDNLADNITAPSLGRLQVRADKNVAGSGSFGAGLTLTGNTLPGAKVKATLGGARIGNGLTGADWNITGNAGTISAGGTIKNWTLTTASGVRGLRLGNVVTADLDVDGRVGKVSALRWDGGTISAATVGSLRSATTFGANLALTGPNGGVGLTLGCARIAGSLIGAGWDVAGDAGKIQVGWWGAGSSLSVTQPGGQRGQVAAVAGSLAKLRMGGYDAQNSGVAFGITVGTFAKGPQVGRTKFAVSDLPFVDGDFRMTTP